MATQYQNLSDYDSETMPSKECVANQRYAIAVSDWNSEITHSLLEATCQTLLDNGIAEKNIDIVHVPGTFELTYAANVFKKSEQNYSAIVVLGCVIKGETPHFDYVCSGVTQGITELNLQSGCPVIFGVLTTNTLEQAKERAGGKLGNKGTESAITAIKMANIFL